MTAKMPLHGFIGWSNRQAYCYVCRILSYFHLHSYSLYQRYEFERYLIDFLRSYSLSISVFLAYAFYRALARLFYVKFLRSDNIWKKWP